MLGSLRARFVAACGALLVSATAFAAGEGWVADYDEALEFAKAQKKDLFVDFTGSDWCGWCKRLDAEVFSKPEFLAAVKDKYVLVALDYPRADAIKAKVPNPQRNDELAKLHAIQGFPTILLIDVDGDVFGQTQYVPGGPAPFLESLSKIESDGRRDLSQAKALRQGFESAQHAAKSAAWDALCAAYEGAQGGGIAQRALSRSVRAALAFDADNAQGRCLRALKALIAAGQIDDEVSAAARRVDPKNAAGVWERCLKARFERLGDEQSARAAMTELDQFGTAAAVQDKETGFFLYLAAASIAFQHLGETERAKQYATKAKAIGSSNADALRHLDSILSS